MEFQYKFIDSKIYSATKLPLCGARNYHYGV